MTEESSASGIDWTRVHKYAAALRSLNECQARGPMAPLSRGTINTAADLYRVDGDSLAVIFYAQAEDAAAGSPAGDGIACGPAGDVTFDGVEAVRYIGGGVIVVTDPYGEQFHFTVTGSSSPGLVRDWLADMIGKWIEAADRYHVLVERS